MGLKRSGISLISVLISSVILSIVLLASVSVFKQMFDSTKQVRKFQEADSLLQSLRSIVQLGPSISKSGSETAGSDLQKCLDTGATADCDHNVTKSFSLYTPTGTLVAGTNTSPVRYNLSGKVCATVGEECPLEAVARFTPAYPDPGGGPPSSCAQAQTMEVSVILRQAASVSLSKGVRRLANREASFHLNVQGLQTSDRTCPAGEFIKGINMDGTIDCDLPSGSILTEGSVSQSGQTVSRTVTTTERAIFVISGMATGRYFHATEIKNAGVLGQIVVNGSPCNSDFSFEGSSANINFYSSVSCVIALNAGTHTLTVKNAIGPYAHMSNFIVRMRYVVLNYP